MGEPPTEYWLVDVTLEDETVSVTASSKEEAIEKAMLLDGAIGASNARTERSEG